MPGKEGGKRRTAKYRFELLIPTAYNDGNPVEIAKIQAVREALIGKFGGCRIQPAAPYRGWWVHRDQTYEDWLILFTVEGDRVEANLTWFETFKHERFSLSSSRKRYTLPSPK